jgi:act minimal PKS acyl carrier protein
MSEFTVDDLRQVVREVAGADAGVDVEGAAPSATYEEIGLDSLAVLEITARLTQRTGREIPEGLVEKETSLQATVDLLHSGRLAA